MCTHEKTKTKIKHTEPNKKKRNNILAKDSLHVSLSLLETDKKQSRSENDGEKERRRKNEPANVKYTKPSRRTKSYYYRRGIAISLFFAVFCALSLSHSPNGILSCHFFPSILSTP